MDVKDTGTIDSSVLLQELLKNQLKNVPITKKLSYSDLKRVIKYINTSIFDNNKCCIWNGYVTNSKPDKNHKGAYVNFYFKKKKVALHRLLYANFKEDIQDSDYLKYTCDNKGSCCNVNHMVKFAYSTNKGCDESGSVQRKNRKRKTTRRTNKKETSNRDNMEDINSDNEDSFMISFG
jgi:hypothetical protein